MREAVDKQNEYLSKEIVSKQNINTELQKQVDLLKEKDIHYGEQEEYARKLIKEAENKLEQAERHEEEAREMRKRMEKER